MPCSGPTSRCTRHDLGSAISMTSRVIAMANTVISRIAAFRFTTPPMAEPDAIRPGGRNLARCLTNSTPSAIGNTVVAPCVSSISRTPMPSLSCVHAPGSGWTASRLPITRCWHTSSTSCAPRCNSPRTRSRYGCAGIINEQPRRITYGAAFDPDRAEVGIGASWPRLAATSYRATADAGRTTSDSSAHVGRA